MKKIYILLFLITIGCSNNKVVKNHGIVGLEVKNDKIHVSKTNKNDVLKIIGNPSTESLFDENIWFYFEREKVNQSIIKLGKLKINKNNILEIAFDNYGIVKSKRLYVINDMNKIDLVKEVTLKNYDKTSPITNVIKSLEQKINSPTRSKSNKN